MESQYQVLKVTRCKHRTRKIAWCNKLQKFCDAPNEYTRCLTYQPKIEYSKF
ncbi:MAG: hypothetical protein NWE96_00220 [Candidatus Bathyarchaeota archaeon]|nr:hypothetical protein [Candidatus Bathyarchaeota archaeon]